MNKRTWLFLLICLTAAMPSSGLAQTYDDPADKEDTGKPYGEGAHSSPEIPSGMELISVGGIRMIVPKGTKVGKKGSLLIMEGTDEFAARRFEEMNTRLETMEANQKDLGKTVDDLKREISDLRKK